MNWRSLGTALSLAMAAFGAAPSWATEEPRGRIDQRFADDSVTETPDFRMHVVPLLGRLGCNGRACHGSFQGQGGLRLSLFGYDFKADHEGLVLGDKPRVDKANPAASLMLQKATMTVDHEGGERAKINSWQYRVLKKWIDGGALPVDLKQAPEFVKLHVTPEEVVGKATGEQHQIRAIVEWSDGTREDVTPLCRFSSNDDQVVAVDEQGLMTVTGKGDTHLVVFYDNGVSPIPVMLPISTDPLPPLVARTPIDQHVAVKLTKLGIQPSDVCTDAEFLRRVSLDLAGVLPTADEATAFLHDSSTDKRSRKIDELLERPSYSVWWATRLSDYLGNNAKNLNNQGGGNANECAAEWHEWLRKRVDENVAYDDIVEGVVLANSRKEGESYQDYCDRMSRLYWKGSGGSYADQHALGYFWSRRNFQKLEERSLGFAYSFLGIRIQCAECHKHPFDQWTKDDFDRFKQFFARVRVGNQPNTKDEVKTMLAGLGVDQKLKGNDLQRVRDKLLRDGKIVPFDEVYVMAAERRDAGKPRKEDKGRKAPAVAGRTAKILGGDEVALDELADPRIALMEWLRSDDNPYFAKAFVNRVWSNYFNVGIVDPPDDVSLANPPSNAPLLDYLARGFVASGYDMKWLHREITNSDAYQRGWKTNSTNELDDRNFSHATPRRLPAEVAYDAIFQATASDEAIVAMADMRNRAISDVANTRRNNGVSTYALQIFGRSSRESNCDCDRSMEPSLLQTVYLQNDAEMLSMIDRKGGWLDQIVKSTERSAKTKVEQPTETIPAGRRRKEATRAQLADRLEKLEKKGRVKEAGQLRTQLEALDAQIEAEKATAVAEELVIEEARLPAIIEQAYLRTLSRRPAPEELKRAIEYIHDSDKPATGIRDVLWALLNTKEFIINH